MVPDIAKSGHSFKGAMAYYLHDKGQQTAERVAWTETRNMMDVGPHTATRIMIATASQADELKRAAGVKATGRKSKAHVYAFSLAWHPDEKATLTREHMLSCADEALKVLGADGRQALIVCHQDEPQPHVHVIVNRVHPETGIMLDTGNDRLKLGDWALDYRRKRGEELKYCPKREEKRQLREQFAEKTQRREYAAEQMAAAKERTAADKSPAAMLREFGAQQREQHSAEWKALSEGNKAARDRIYADTQEKIKATISEGWKARKSDFAALKETAREEWREHGRAHHAMTRELHRSNVGMVGGLVAVFGLALSKGAAESNMRGVQEARREQVARQVKAEIDGKIAALKDERAKALAAQRQQFDAARAALIEKQGAERAKIRQAWQQIPRDRQFPKNGPDRPQAQQRPAPNKSRADRVAERSNPNNLDHARRLGRRDNRGIETARAKATRNDRALSQAQQKAAPKPEQKPMKREFDDARKIEAQKAPPVRHEPQRITTPAPQLQPQGVPQPKPATVQNVPQVNRAAEWAKTPEGKAELARQQMPPAPARQQFQKAAPEQTLQPQSLRDRFAAPTKPAPAQQTPAQAPQQQSLRDRWGQQADRDRAAEKARPANERARDRDFDRDR